MEKTEEIKCFLGRDTAGVFRDKCERFGFSGRCRSELIQERPQGTDFKYHTTNIRWLDLRTLWRHARRLGQAVMRLRKIRILQNLGWLTGGQLVGDFAAFIFFILLSRHFGPEGIGDYAFGLAVAMVGRTLVSLGVDNFGIREVATRTTEEANELVGRILGAQCWLGLLYVAGCAGFLIIAAASPGTIVVASLLAVYHLSAGLVRSLFLPAFAAERMVGPALLDSGSRVIAIIGGIAVLFLEGDSLAKALVSFPVCGVLLVGAAFWQARGELGGLRPNLYPRSVLTVARQAWPFAAGQIVFRLHSRADVVMLSLIVGSAATGIYAAGIKFVEVGMMIVSLFGIALYPTLTRLIEDNEEGFDLAVTTLVKGGAFACVVLGWGVFVFVPDLIPHLFGTEFRKTEWVIKLFAVLVPVKGVAILGDRLMLAAGREVQKLRFQAIATGLNIAFNGALIPALAVEGAIVASVVSLAVNATLLVRYLEKFSSQPLGKQLVEDMSPLFAASFLAAAIGIYALPGDIWATLAFIVSFVGAGVFTGFTSSMQRNVVQLVEQNGGQRKNWS